MNGLSIIPARSEKQALDWSVVLLSQGIESTIEGPAEDHGWQLLVDPPQTDDARRVLQQYVLENRRPWVSEVPGTDLLFDARSAAWFLVIIIFYTLSQTWMPELRAAGLADNHAIRAGEWWRIFTAVMLHGDLGHLAANVTTGVLFLGLAMGSFGAGHSALAAFLAGAAGNVAGIWFHTGGHRSLGASGMVMGALGLLTAQSLSWWRSGGFTRNLVGRGVAAGFLLLLLLGLDPSTDVVAHVGGFVGGFFFGALMTALPPATLQSVILNRVADLVCAALMITAWAFALAQHR